MRFDYPPKSNHDRVYPLNVESVKASEGTPAQYTIESGDADGVGLKRIKIGDPDRTISGRHTYEITYTLRGVLNGFEDHDELNLNAIGPGWTVPIQRATATVEAPADITQVACFSGPLRSTLPCSSATSSGTTATFAQSNIPPNGALTVVVGMPKGAVPPPKPILEERFNLGTAFSITPVTAGVSGALLLVVILVFAFLIYRFGRDRRYRGSAVDQAYGTDGGADELVPVFHHEETPVEFVPPDKLRPGQLGTLVDFTANPLDVTATIVDLAVRGYLVIEEIPGEGGFLHKPDWKLTKKKESGCAELKDYEQKLLNGLFEDGNEVQLSDLRYTFHTKMEEVQGALLQDAIDHGWFVKPPSRSSCPVGLPRSPRAPRRRGAHDAADPVHARGSPRHPAPGGGHPVHLRGVLEPPAHGQGHRRPPAHRGIPEIHQRVGEGTAPSSPNGRTCSPSICPTRSSSARRGSGRRRSPVSTTSRRTRRRGTSRRRRSRSSRSPARSTALPCRRRGR